jgi:hypothetical protein
MTALLEKTEQKTLPTFLFENCAGANRATPAQCADLLTRAGAALAVVMKIPDQAGIRLAISPRHPLPGDLLAELHGVGIAIGKMMAAADLIDNACPDCGGPLCFELEEQGRYIRAVCTGRDGCGWLRIFGRELIG